MHQIRNGLELYLHHHTSPSSMRKSGGRFQINIKNPNSRIIFIRRLIFWVTYVPRGGARAQKRCHFSNGGQISYDPAQTAHPIKDDSLTFRLSTSNSASVWGNMRVVSELICVCVCMWMLCAGRAHTVFYRGVSPTSIRGVLVSSAPDNTPCSIIMRRHTPLGTQAFSSLSSLSCYSLTDSLLLSVFLLKVSFSSLLLVVLER